MCRKNLGTNWIQLWTLRSKTQRCCYNDTTLSVIFQRFFSNLNKQNILNCCYCLYDSNSFEPKIHGIQILCGESKYWRYFEAILMLKQIVLTPRCQWHRWFWFLSGIDTPESDSALSLTPLSQTLLCHWHPWVRIYSVTDTANSAESLTPPSLTPLCHWHCWVKLRGVIDTTQSDSARHWRRRVIKWHRKKKVLSLTKRIPDFEWIAYSKCDTQK